MLGVDLPPAGARFHGGHPTYGAPVHVAFYADGFQICAYLVGSDPTIGQDAQRKYLTYRWDAAQQTFAQLALPAQPRPLYRPENLEAHPDWRVYVFEREDMVDAFHTLSGDDPSIATTAPGGCTEFELADWGPLYGRQVTLWPTHTAASQTEMHDLASRLQKSGAKVSVLEIPQDLPDGWSFHDLVASGWTWAQCSAFISKQLREVVEPVKAIRSPKPNPPDLTVVSLDERRERKVRQPPLQVRSLRDTWAQVKGLQLAPNGTPYSHLANAIACLESAPGLYADVWYDEFYGRIMTGPDTSETPSRQWTDADAIELTVELQQKFGLTGIRTNVVHEAVAAIAHRRRRHEVREWLEGLDYDGGTPLLQAAHLGWGCKEGDPYTTAVVRCFIMGAVARILKPGCQVDNVPVFEGPGGSKKTSSLRVLFGMKWFDNPSAYMGEKDFLQNMRGKWCLELGELANIRGRAIEAVKTIITRREDTYRASYGRISETHLRQCVFAGTIDRGGWNTDQAGGRRWWPLRCGDINLDWIAEQRSQLFAEAVERLSFNEKWWDVPEAEARAQQLARHENEAWLPLIRNMVSGLKEVSVGDVFRGALGAVEPRDWRPSDQERVRRCLSILGWQQAGDLWYRDRS